MFQGLGIIAKFLYIIVVIVIAHGGWQVRSGNADMGKISIVGGLLLGLAVVIADALSGGRDANHHPRQMSKAVINMHAGDVQTRKTSASPMACSQKLKPDSAASRILLRSIDSRFWKDSGNQPQ